MNTEKKLEVKNLVISFRTQAGRVRAVRDISFDLHKGETLAIVGESGSGKSVTSKAILGILAGNAIVDGGEIIYDGQDLLKIKEDEFYKIRGDKIAMIFQDPLSSLNPIMRIGRQLTEAMLLKGKARQRASRRELRRTLRLLSQAMVLAASPEEKAAKRAECRHFRRFEIAHTRLEQAFNRAAEAAKEAISECEDLALYVEKNAISVRELRLRIRSLIGLAGDAVNPYVVPDSESYRELIANLGIAASFVKSNPILNLLRRLKLVPAAPAPDISGLLAPIRALGGAIKDETDGKPVPNFFRMGYYLTYSNDPLPDLPVAELDEFLLAYMRKDFMDGFLADAEAALRLSAELHDVRKGEMIRMVRELMPCFTAKTLDRAACSAATRALCRLSVDSIDRLENKKDSIAYTFASAFRHAVATYFGGVRNNGKMQKKHDRQQAKYDRLIAKGKTPDWKPTPAATVDLELAKANIIALLNQISEHYEKVLASASARDYAKETNLLVDRLRDAASGIVQKVTRRMAKHKALKLMEEVGISEPRRRYRQYPFEFSGGMRQRIVIAIALAANPDILICDEPTTALDVTIQAQILELINRLKRERQLSIIFITHDLGVVANMADRIAVMYAGKIVEYGTAEDVFYAPAHPYTWALLSSMPDLDTDEKLEAIPGTPPNMIYPPVGDAFADRNKYAMQIDFEMQPPMFEISETHSAATWLLHPNAPRVQPPKAVTERIARMQERREEENTSERKDG